MALHFQQGSSFAGGLANSTANALSSGLDALIESKTKKLQQQHDYQKRLTGLQALGVDNAEQLAHLDDQSLQQIIKNKIEEPSRQAYAEGLQSLVGGQQPQQQQQQQEQPFSLDSVTPEQKQQIGEYLKSDMAKQSNINPEHLDLLQKFISSPAAASGKKQSASPVAQKPKPQLNEKQATELAKLGLKKQQMTADERKFEHKVKADAYKETKDVRHKLVQDASDAKESLQDLERLEELEKEGKLDTPGYVSFLERAGLDIPALMNPGSEEFNKIQNNFLRFAKSYVGGRVLT